MSCATFDAGIKRACVPRGSPHGRVLELRVRTLVHVEVMMARRVLELRVRTSVHVEVMMAHRVLELRVRASVHVEVRMARRVLELRVRTSVHGLKKANTSRGEGRICISGNRRRARCEARVCQRPRKTCRRPRKTCRRSKTTNASIGR